MSDLTDRLRRWAISTDAVPASDLMDEAAAQIELLDAAHKASHSALLVIDSGFKNALAEIERLRSQPCPYVTGDTTRFCTLTPFTLTDAEREAILGAIEAEHGRGAWQWAATLRTLLERTA